jgi:AcrR family transcriptional regulator
MRKAPSQDRSLATVENILQAAKTLLKTDIETSQFTMRDLSIKSGYSVGSIYQYFKDKEEIFFKLIELEIEAVNRSTLTVIGQKNLLSYSQSIKCLVKVLIDIVENDKLVKVKLINWMVSSNKSINAVKMFIALLDQFFSHLKSTYPSDFQNLTETQIKICKHTFLNLIAVLLFDYSDRIDKESFGNTLSKMIEVCLSEEGQETVI